MKISRITKVTYQKAFITGPFLQEKIGFEAEVDVDADIAHCLSDLKKMAEDWHRSANPHLYQQESAPEIVRSFTPQQTGPSVAVIDYKEKEQLEIAIDNATSLSQLEEIKDKCWKNDLSHQYIIKFNELNNGSTGSFTEGLG